MPNDHLENMRAIGTATARTAAAADLPPMPAQPTLVDILTLRMHKPKFGLPFAAAHHGVQCASLAMKAGADEETVLQLNSNGPWGLTYVNEKDDPRKTQ